MTGMVMVQRFSGVRRHVRDYGRLIKGAARLLGVELRGRSRYCRRYRLRLGALAMVVLRRNDTGYGHGHGYSGGRSGGKNGFARVGLDWLPQVGHRKKHGVGNRRVRGTARIYVVTVAVRSAPRRGRVSSSSWRVYVRAGIRHRVLYIYMCVCVFCVALVANVARGGKYI